MPKYNVELCKRYDAGGKLLEKWYEISILQKRKKFWLFGPLIDTDEKWEFVKETVGGGSGDSFKVVKKFYTMEDVGVFINNNEKGLTDKIVRKQAFMGLGN